MAIRFGKITEQLNKISLGVVIVSFWIFVLIKAPELYPTNTEEFRAHIITLIVIVTLISSLDAGIQKRFETPFLRTSFLKAFPRFMITAFLGIIALSLLGLTIPNTAQNSILEAVLTIGFGVLIFHALFVSIIEERLKTWIQRQLQANKMPRILALATAIIIWTLFHWTFGGEWINLLIYPVLGVIFAIVRDKFSPQTDMANSGLHFSWNLFILGVIG